MLAKVWMTLWTWTMAGVCLSMFLSFELDLRSDTWVSATWAVAGLSTSAVVMLVDGSAVRRAWVVRPGMRFVCALVLGVLLFPFFIRGLAGFWPAYGPEATDRAKQARDVLALSTLNVGAWALGYLWTDSMQAKARAEHEATRARAESSQMALALLGQQLHPHFLFNAINTLSSVVEEEPRRAQQLLRELSDVLHFALQGSAQGLVPVARELELLTPYLALERARWEDELQVRVHVMTQAHDALVPWMSIQLLLENAIKHSTKTEAGPRDVELVVRVEEGSVRVEVSNSGRLEQRPGPRGAGVGLRNLQERLRRLYSHGVALSLEQHGLRVVATMRVPVEVGS